MNFNLFFYIPHDWIYFYTPLPIIYLIIVRFQFIDIPGLLTVPKNLLNERENELCEGLPLLSSCSFLYFLDVSETCGQTIEQQVD